MPRKPTYPLAEHPLDNVAGKPACSLPLWDPAYLNAVMLEGSLEKCRSYVKGWLLDIGCGRRPYERTFFTQATRYVGADYLTDRSRPDVVTSALHLPFAGASFDTVASTEVLEHVPAPLLALAEMRRVIKPGGHLILSTPMYWPRHEVPYDFFRYPYDGLLYLLQQSGWQMVRMFNRGRVYAHLGQVFQHASPFRARWWDGLVNGLCLWCDRRLRNDAITLGWTVVARPAAVPAVSATSAAAAETE